MPLVGIYLLIVGRSLEKKDKCIAKIVATISKVGIAKVLKKKSLVNTFQPQLT